MIKMKIYPNAAVNNMEENEGKVLWNGDTKSEIKERITKRYERKRIIKPKLFTLGYTTSGDPWKIGTNKFPNPPNKPGITKKKIIRNPCKVMFIL